MNSNDIKALLKQKGITQKELAARCGWSTTNLANRLKRDTWTIADLEKIATAIGGDLEVKIKTE